MLQLAPTPRDTIVRDGNARLIRFTTEADRSGAAILLVPSLINRWYVLDLRPGASLVQALVDGGFDVFCLDWGVPGDEDRHLRWDEVVARIGRAMRIVRRLTSRSQVGLLGYCMGGTLSAIHTALHPRDVAAFVNLAGPIDFSQAGALGHMVSPRWFDPAAMAGAGNISGLQMQSGFMALRPTLQFAKWIGFLDRMSDPKARDAFIHLEAWANDNVSFPAAAYVRYIEDLYQQNQLVRGRHHVGGRRVDLSAIRCPILHVVASRDTICPPAAAVALGERSGSDDVETLTIPGGHVGAVVGSKAQKTLYPGLVRWFTDKLES